MLKITILRKIYKLSYINNSPNVLGDGNFTLTYYLDHLCPTNNKRRTKILNQLNQLCLENELYLENTRFGNRLHLTDKGLAHLNKHKTYLFTICNTIVTATISSIITYLFMRFL